MAGVRVGRGTAARAVAARSSTRSTSTPSGTTPPVQRNVSSTRPGATPGPALMRISSFTTAAVNPSGNASG